jgi:hypothetical protein
VPSWIQNKEDASITALTTLYLSQIPGVKIISSENEFNCSYCNKKQHIEDE